MTVTNNEPIVAWTGNGATTIFPFSFVVIPQNKALLNVYIQRTSDFVTIKTLLQSEFTVDFEPAGNGSVIYAPIAGALAAGYRIVIERAVPYIQELELTRYGGYDGPAIMRSFDKQELQIQQLAAKLDRAVITNYGTEVSDLTAAIQAAAGFAADAAASADEAEGWANVAAQHLADAEEIQEVIDAVLPSLHTFSGNGVTVSFDLVNVTILELGTMVYISGVYQNKGGYSIVDGVLVFSEAPPSGVENIEVIVAGTYAITAPPAGTTWIKIVGALPEDNNFEGRTVYFTVDNKLYTWDGAQWNSVTGTGEGGGGGGIPTFGFIEPVDTLPDTDNFPGRAIYLLTDQRVYIYVGGSWLAVFGSSTGGGGGGGETPELPDDASYFYIYPILPEVGLFIGQTAYQELDGKLYSWNGTEWVPLVTASDVNFPDGFTGIQIVNTLPASGNTIGDFAYLNSDGKLYRYTASGWTRETAAADLAGQITATQISDGAISTPKLAAGSVVASKISANAVTSDAILAGAILTAKIAAGAVTAQELAAGAVTADKIQAGAITAAKMNVTSLAAISATLGSVNISSAIMGSLQVDTLNIAGNAVTVQAGAETAGGVSIGTGFTIMQSVTISWGSSASIWVMCQFRASVADQLEIDVRSGGGSILPGGPKTLSPKADTFQQYIDLFQSGVASGATLGYWLRRTGGGSTTINARKLMVLAAKR